MDTERSADETEKAAKRRNNQKKYKEKEMNMEKEDKKKAHRGKSTTEVNTITVFPHQTRKNITGPSPAVMRSFMDDFTIVYGPIRSVKTV